MGMLIHRENVRRRMAEEQAKLVEQPKPLPEAPKSDVPEEEPKKKGGRQKKSV